MAPRWHREQVVGTFTKLVMHTLEQREVTIIDEDVASPAGSRPMVRRYPHVPTPQALLVSEEFAEEMHKENLRLHLLVEEEFRRARAAQDAAADEKRRRARERDRERCRRNVELYGTCKKPRLPAGAQPATVAVAGARSRSKRPRIVLAPVSASAVAPVEA